MEAVHVLAEPVHVPVSPAADSGTKLPKAFKQHDIELCNVLLSLGAVGDAPALEGDGLLAMPALEPAIDLLPQLPLSGRRPSFAMSSSFTEFAKPLRPFSASHCSPSSIPRASPLSSPLSAEILLSQSQYPRASPATLTAANEYNDGQESYGEEEGNGNTPPYMPFQSAKPLVTPLSRRSSVDIRAAVPGGRNAAFELIASDDRAPRFICAEAIRDELEFSFPTASTDSSLTANVDVSAEVEAYDACRLLEGLGNGAPLHLTPAPRDRLRFADGTLSCPLAVADKALHTISSEFSMREGRIVPSLQEEEVLLHVVQPALSPAPAGTQVQQRQLCFQLIHTLRASVSHSVANNAQGVARVQANGSGTFTVEADFRLHRLQAAERFGELGVKNVPIHFVFEACLADTEGNVRRYISRPSIGVIIRGAVSTGNSLDRVEFFEEDPFPYDLPEDQANSMRASVLLGYMECATSAYTAHMSNMTRVEAELARAKPMALPSQSSIRHRQSTSPAPSSDRRHVLGKRHKRRSNRYCVKDTFTGRFAKRARTEGEDGNDDDDSSDDEDEL